MASIDRIYVRTYQDWKEIIDYAKKTTFTCPNGQKLKLIDYCYYPDISKTEVENWLKLSIEIPVMLTSRVIDYFLIKYCPIKLIQDRLLKVYDEEYYNSIKNGTSRFDTFVRPEGGKHLSFIDKPKFKKTSKWFNKYQKRWVTKGYHVNIIVPDNKTPLWYNEELDTWIFYYELGTVDSNTANTNCKSVKSVIRKIKKWNLPVGYKVDVWSKYDGECFTMIIKK